jgi:hypothetical protein
MHTFVTARSSVHSICVAKHIFKYNLVFFYYMIHNKCQFCNLIFVTMDSFATIICSLLRACYNLSQFVCLRIVNYSRREFLVPDWTPSGYIYLNRPLFWLSPQSPVLEWTCHLDQCMQHTNSLGYSYIHLWPKLIFVPHWFHFYDF